jgi:hypothetical protein
MQWIKNKWCTDQYYKITKDGEQKSMYDASPFEYILHMHKEKVMQYHFLKPGDSYKIKQPYTVLGLSVTIDDQCYVLPADSFLIQGNVLGDTFLLWLCKNYLHISPGKSEWNVVDTQVQLHTGSIIHVNNELKNDIK